MSLTGSERRCSPMDEIVKQLAMRRAELEQELAKISAMLNIAAPEKREKSSTTSKAKRSRSKGNSYVSQRMRDRVLEYVNKAEGTVRSREVAAGLSISQSTAGKALGILAEKDKAIKFVGNAKGEKGVIALYEKLTTNGNEQPTHEQQQIVNIT